MPTKRQTQTAVAALSVEITDRTGKTLQLLPAGAFRAIDGRPASMPGASCAEWVMNDAAAAAVIAAASARQNRVVIDYDHQTLNKEKNGQPAPAAGWCKTLEWRSGVGLFAVDVEWTPAAAQAIADGEYRYFSPVFTFDKATGRVQSLVMGAITNYAGIDGMQQVSLSAVADAIFNQPEEPQMDKLLELLRKSLGLKADTTEEQITAALTAHLQKVADDANQLVALNAQLQTTQAAQGAPDPAKYVPIGAVAELQTQLAALAGKVNGSEVERVVDKAMADGKLLPAMAEWARDLGNKDMAALNAYIDKAPAIAALTSTQTAGRAMEVDGVALSATELEVAKALGQTPEQFAKGKKAQA